MLVTAQHVVAEAKKIKNSNKSSVRVFAGSIDITLWNILGESQELDICTIEVPKDVDIISIEKSYLVCNCWPIISPQIGDIAFIVGYPAINRQQENTNDILHVPLIIADSITGITDSKIRMDVEDTKRAFYSDMHDCSFDNYGGMSGAPIFIYTNNVLNVVGIFIESVGFSGCLEASRENSTFFGVLTKYIDVHGGIVT